MCIPLRLRGAGLALAAAWLVAWGAGPAVAQIGGFGTAGGGMGGGMGGGDQVQSAPTRPLPPHPVSAEAARTWLKLQQVVNVPFKDETSLGDVLEWVEGATADRDRKGSGVPIYVDPVGLQEAEKTLQSPVQLGVRGITVAKALTLMLEQIGLFYTVDPDGLVKITSRSGEDQPERRAPLTARAARTWLKLQQPIPVAFDDETPLRDVARAIRAKTADEAFASGLPIYVDPVALKMAGRGMDAPVTISLDGVPLATSLALIASQVGLEFRVDDDGIVVFQAEGADEETMYSPPAGRGAETLGHLRYKLQEAKLKAEIARLQAEAASSKAGDERPDK